MTNEKINLIKNNQSIAMLAPIFALDFQYPNIIGKHKGGKTVAENCQMLCKEDNRTKSG